MSSSLSSSLSDSSSGSGGGSGARRGGCCEAKRRTRRSSSSVSSAASEPPPGAPDADAPPAPGFATGGAVIRSSHAAVTPDGWRLHLHRVRPRCPRGGGDAAAAAPGGKRYPVVLCPGLATGGIESFDLDDSVSMAAYLAEAGYDVW